MKEVGLSELVNQDIVFIEELIGLIPDYLKNITIDHGNLERAIASCDVEGASRVVHRIKGSACSYGFDVIDKVVSEIQQSLDKNDYDMALENNKIFEKYLMRVAKALSDRGA
jgi:HPt (histidine-containing phosphotransfer) domain-containing protein